jgi:hypothetical protein
MRDAPDVVYVVSAYLSAYNARAFGVQDYIAQLMFNSPPGLSDAMDLAKMLAIVRLIEPLKTPEFQVWIQTRTGLLSYPLNLTAARSHLAASVYLQMALKPHIIHIVGQSEADHAATAEEVIEACGLARRAIDNALRGAPDMTADPAIQKRADELVRQSQVTLQAIRSLAGSDIEDPLIHASTLAKAVTSGILDAPQLKNNPFGRGVIKTGIINGACQVVGSDNAPLKEEYRIKELMAKGVIEDGR